MYLIGLKILIVEKSRITDPAQQLIFNILSSSRNTLEIIALTIIFIKYLNYTNLTFKTL